jgi:signal transduction histidine kinase
MSDPPGGTDAGRTRPGTRAEMATPEPGGLAAPSGGSGRAEMGGSAELAEPGRLDAPAEPGAPAESATAAEPGTPGGPGTPAGAGAPAGTGGSGEPDGPGEADGPRESGGSGEPRGLPGRGGGERGGPGDARAAATGAGLAGAAATGGDTADMADADAEAGTAGATRAERARAMTARLVGGWPLRRIFGVGVLTAALFAVLVIAVGGAALADLAGARSRLVDTIDPAAFHASQLEAAYLNQETGVRGYALSAKQPYLAPYFDGLAQERQEVSRLHTLLAGMPAASADLARVISRADAWRTSYAEPTIRLVKTSGKPYTGPTVAAGKAHFDSLRAGLSALQGNLSAERAQAVSGLNHAATVLDATGIGLAIALLAVLIVFAFGLQRSVIWPLDRLAADARQVADGDFDHHVDPGGPQEMRTVGLDVNRMRERILADLSAVRVTHASLAAAHASLAAAHASLEARTEDLQRSNAELEQFAYVASHDLQEPLRKVASFCQLLQRRYVGQLDAKADEYIAHAVDGATRMQELINDLLAFSRVGRTAQRREPVSCAVLLGQAWANLAPAARQARATIEVGDLPVVLGEASLLTTVFQNLLGNALKFAGDQPPRISVSARRDGQYWLFSVADNGIGIPAEYADRIFVIFQRLHDRTMYPGTGIGLAMCRKIIEYHGGRIWLDTTVTTGARFCFTLPVRAGDQDTDD